MEETQAWIDMLDAATILITVLGVIVLILIATQKTEI
jgi:hypothetical protein